MSQLTPEQHMFITQLRLRSQPGAEQPPTLDEMKRAILILRGARKLAVEAASTSAKRSSKKPAPSAAVVTGDLGSLLGLGENVPT